MSIKVDWQHSIRFDPELEMRFGKRRYSDIDTKKIFENIFAGYDDSKMVCTLRFVSPEEIKKHEPRIDYTTRDTCIKLINDLLMTAEKGEEICKCINDIRYNLERLSEILEADKRDKNEKSASIIKECIQGLEYDISRIKECKNECCKNKKLILKVINELMEELYALQFPEHYSLLGCYCRTYKDVKDLIFICPENILRSSERKNTGFLGLLFSVVVHEYAHFVDANTELHEIPMSKKEEVLYSALQETIAETVQKLFIDQYIDKKWKSQELQDWINDHSASGRFPGWGYAGAKILDKERKHSLEDLLIKVIEISRKDWRAGYHFINSIKILENM